MGSEMCIRDRCWVCLVPVEAVEVVMMVARGAALLLTDTECLSQRSRNYVVGIVNGLISGVSAMIHTETTSQTNSSRDLHSGLV